MQDTLLNPATLEQTLLVLRMRNQSYDAEIILAAKMWPARLAPIQNDVTKTDL